MNERGQIFLSAGPCVTEAAVPVVMSECVCNAQTKRKTQRDSVWKTKKERKKFGDDLAHLTKT